MERHTPITLVVVAAVVLTAVAGVGLVAAADMPHATDGDIANGEEIKAAEDDDDQVFEINYTFRLQNHQPGHTDGTASHFAVGLTENGTLHRIRLVSDDIGFGNCDAGDARAFGIDRGNDDPGTTTDKSLLTAYKSYESTEDYIDIRFYRESRIAGEPVRGTVDDEVVSQQTGCYDNPSEPGWYRVNGTITGNVGGGTDTDYKIRDLSTWVYVCDCDSRREAERRLGPPPGQGDGDGSDGGGSDGGTGESSPTPTATATPTSGADDGAGSGPTPTATATPTKSAEGRDDGNGAGDAGGGATSPPTATDTSGDGGDGGEDGTASTATTRTDTETGTDGSTGTGTPTATTGATGATGTSAGGDGGFDGGGGTSATPTDGGGPGFGVVVTLVGLLATALLARRRT